MSLAGNINRIKKEKGYTNAALSEVSGIAKSTIDKLTSGESTNPKLNTLKSLCFALKCTLDDLDADFQLTKNSPIYNLTEKESILIEKHRDLDKTGKEAVEVMINFAHSKTNTNTNS